MRITFKTLLFSSAALCATASFAASTARINVPFSFTAKGQTFPAGTYDISMDAQNSFVTLANRANLATQISWIVRPGAAAKSPAVVRFDVRGSGYELKNIQLGDKVTPNLDGHNKPGIGATTSISGQ